MATKRGQQFFGRVTVIYGQFESSDAFLVEAKNEARAREIVETVIKADNLETIGFEGDGFSWFAHGTDETAVKDNYSLQRITPASARVLSKVGRVQYLNQAYQLALDAISKAEETKEANA